MLRFSKHYSKIWYFQFNYIKFWMFQEIKIFFKPRIQILLFSRKFLNFQFFQFRNFHEISEFWYFQENFYISIFFQFWNFHEISKFSIFRIFRDTLGYVILQLCQRDQLIHENEASQAKERDTKKRRDELAMRVQVKHV